MLTPERAYYLAIGIFVVVCCISAVMMMRRSNRYFRRAKHHDDQADQVTRNAVRKARATKHLLYENSSQKFFLEVDDRSAPPYFCFSIAELLDGPVQPWLTLDEAQKISRRIAEIIHGGFC
jgi:protease II